MHELGIVRSTGGKKKKTDLELNMEEETGAGRKIFSFR